MKKIIKAINIIVYLPLLFGAASLILMFLFVLFYSKNSELNSMSNNDIKDYFHKNKEDLNRVIDFCEKYPSIYRIDRTTVKFYEKDISKQSNKAGLDIQKIILQTQIDSVECSRLKDILDNNLLGVSFVLYSAGLGVSGKSQLIEYETFRSQKYWEKKKRIEVPWQTSVPMTDDGWSVVHTK